MVPKGPTSTENLRPQIAFVFWGTFALIARLEPDAWVAVAFGIIPLALGLGFFLDAALIRRDLKA